MKVSTVRAAWILALTLVAGCGDDGPTEPQPDPTVTVTIVNQRPAFQPPFSATRQSGELDLKGTFSAPCAGVTLSGEARHEDGTLYVHIIGEPPVPCEGPGEAVAYDALVTSAGGSAILTVQHSLAGETAEIVYTATFN